MDSNNDVIARRYTDEHYLTKSELQAEMRTSLVEPYWNAVVAYREQFKRPLPFDGIGHTPFFLIETTTIREHIQAFSRRLDVFLAKLGKLLQGPEGPAIKKALMFELMDALNVDGNFQMSQYSIKAVINGTYDDDQPFHQPLVNYHSLVEEMMASTQVGSIEDFLAHAYGTLRGEVDDLTEFYRVRELDPSIRKLRFLVDAEYSCAPLSEVEPLMEAFLSYLGASSDVPFVRAALSEYFLYYVKPFDKDYNGMMASILMKEQYASLTNQPLAYLFPFEKLLLRGKKNPSTRLATPSEMKEQKRYENLRKDIQRTGDLTYVVFDAVESIGTIIDGLEDLINRVRLEAVRNENRPSPEEQRAASVQPLPEIKEAILSGEPTPVYRKEDAVTPIYVAEERKEAEPEPVTTPAEPAAEEPPAPGAAPVEPLPIEREPELEPAPDPLPEPEPPEESEPAFEPEPAPRAEARSEHRPDEERREEPSPSPRKEEPSGRKAAGRTTLEPSRVIKPEDMAGEKSLVLEPQRLTEREAKEYMMYLLETNPSLSKKQASFLSTHCTMGRYYSIQQFKAYARVAYETARTSMDKLAALGYYEKLQVKNKFVYTPVLKGRSAK